MNETKFKKGDRVTYTDQMDRQYPGIVKSQNEKYVFVVYNCGEEWHNYEDFTAQATLAKDLEPGWPGEDADINQVLSNATDLLADLPDPEEPHATEYTIAKMLLSNVAILLQNGYPSTTPVRPTLQPYDGRMGDLPPYEVWHPLEQDNLPEQKVLMTSLELGATYRELMVGYIEIVDGKYLGENDHQTFPNPTHYRFLAEVLPPQ